MSRSFCFGPRAMVGVEAIKTEQPDENILTRGGPYGGRNLGAIS